MAYRAEPAIAGAPISENEKGRRSPGETLAEIGAAGFLTNRVQTSLFHEFSHYLVSGPGRDSPLQPGRLWQTV
jgi:hypothetical protein